MIRKIILHLLPYILVGIILVSCQSASTRSEDMASDNAIDITNIELERQSALCDDYVGTYVSQITDSDSNQSYSGALTISIDSDLCRFETNSIPNHNFSSENFAHSVQSNSVAYSIQRSPVIANNSTEISLQLNNAVFLNGVKLDLLSAGCYGIRDGKIGCNDMNSAWRYDPMSPTNNFGTDSHNAHTQPDGTYHYHGSPMALFSTSDTTKASPVIGFAADGFPIYGPYFEDENGQITKALSGYTLRVGQRKSQTNEASFPGGYYDGTFVDDYEFTESGNLDECNGQTVDGQYGYYVTDTYPWILACLKGTPHESFKK